MVFFKRKRPGDRHNIMLLGVGPAFVVLILIGGWFYFYGRQFLQNPNRLLPYMIVALVLGILLLTTMD